MSRTQTNQEALKGGKMCKTEGTAHVKRADTFVALRFPGHTRSVNILQ